MKLKKSDLRRIGQGIEHKRKTTFVCAPDTAGIGGIFLREILNKIGYSIESEHESVIDDSIIFDTNLPYDVYVAAIPANDILQGLGTFAYGTKPSESNPRIASVDVNEIATIDTIKQRYKEGDSLRAIARWLNGEGIKTRKGTDWHPTQIRRILERVEGC